MIAALELKPPWLEVRLSQLSQACSWAIVGGGMRSVDRVIWRQVSNRDLPPNRDPVAWFADEMATQGWHQALGFLTSHPLQHVETTVATHEELQATCVATVGLGNGRRIGDAPGPGRVGTINILCAVSAPLSPTALLEAMALAAEARTTACLEANYASPISGQPITGTGTDCIAVVSPQNGAPQTNYAGKHTAVGHLIGKSVYEAVTKGIASWEKERTCS